MFKNRTVFTGPADKLMVNGVFYKAAFLNMEEAIALIASRAGLIEDVHSVVDGDSVIKDVIYDTEENAIAALAPWPDNCYLDKVGMLSYEEANGITHTIETLPA